MCDIGKRHGAPVGNADAAGKRQIVLKLTVDLMAGGAGDGAVAAHSDIEEQTGTKCRGGWIVRDAVGGLRRQRTQFGEPELADQPLLLFREFFSGARSERQQRGESRASQEMVKEARHRITAQYWTSPRPGPLTSRASAVVPTSRSC